MLGLGMSAADGVQLNGQLGATDQEADEGYFALSPDVMIMVKPGSPAHRWLKSRTGQRVVLTIAPEPASQ